MLDNELDFVDILEGWSNVKDGGKERLGICLIGHRDSSCGGEELGDLL